MIRGVRGATTVGKNTAEQILENTKRLFEDIIAQNDIAMEAISHVFISVTDDINAVFPARALRDIPGSTFVPVMCMTEIDVPEGLPKCIRIMMVINTNKKQSDIEHIFHNEAIKLRPDLLNQEGE